MISINPYLHKGDHSTNPSSFFAEPTCLRPHPRYTKRSHHEDDHSTRLRLLSDHIPKMITPLWHPLSSASSTRPSACARCTAEPLLPEGGYFAPSPPLALDCQARWSPGVDAFRHSATPLQGQPTHRPPMAFLRLGNQARPASMHLHPGRLGHQEAARHPLPRATGSRRPRCCRAGARSGRRRGRRAGGARGCLVGRPLVLWRWRRTMPPRGALRLGLARQLAQDQCCLLQQARQVA